jgi:hypothetical protein
VQMEELDLYLSSCTKNHLKMDLRPQHKIWNY